MAGWTAIDRDGIKWDGTIHSEFIGTSRTPVNNTDIANKKYVDDNAYTDADAVSAIATEDAYIKNTGDTGSGTYNFDSNTLVVNSANHRIGVGTASPNFPFEVIDTGANVAHFGSVNNGVLIGRDGTVGKVLGYGAAGYNDLDIRAKSTQGTQLYLKTDGNVGINTTNPSQKLHVVGSTIASGGILTNVAEPSSVSGAVVLFASGGILYGKNDDDSVTQIT